MQNQLDFLKQCLNDYANQLQKEGHIAASATVINQAQNAFKNIEEELASKQAQIDELLESENEC